MYQKILFLTRSNASAVTPLSPTGKLLDIFHLEIYVKLTKRVNKMNVLLHKLYVYFCRTLSHMQMYSLFFAPYPAAVLHFCTLPNPFLKCNGLSVRCMQSVNESCRTLSHMQMYSFFFFFCPVPSCRLLPCRISPHFSAGEEPGYEATLFFFNYFFYLKGHTHYPPILNTLLI